MDTTSRGQKTILVVDDGNDIRSIYSDTLQFFGYRVVAVECAAAALAQLGQQHIDAIVTDFWLPRMTGAAMAAAIRSDVRHHNIPISLVSSAPPKREDAELFTRILRKPCGFDELLEVVDQMCFENKAKGKIE